nr:uncharacterized protein LOC107462117 [Ipomoea trifida]
MNRTWDVEQMHYTPTASNAWKGENLAWYANVEVPEEEHDAMVADYWDEERGWNDYLFQGILPDEITDKLKACMLSNDNDAQDELFWEPEANGNFSVTSAYGLIQGDIESHNDKGWERLWQVAESVRAFEKISQPASNTHNKVQRLIRWTKPPDGWTKMNIDGSRDTLTGHASCGGLLRDVNGNWLLGFKAKVGHCSIEEAKAWSILKGLKTIWNHGYRKVIIESDAKRVVDWINASEYEKSPTGMVANIINECRKWLRMNWQIQLNHVFREQNKVADALARMALKSTNDWMFLPQPESELLGLLNDDILGIPVSRLVCTES